MIDLVKDVQARIGSNVKIWLVGIALLVIVLPNLLLSKTFNTKMQWLVIGTIVGIVGTIDRWQAFDTRVAMNDTSAIARQVRRQLVHNQLSMLGQTIDTKALPSSTLSAESDQLAEEYEQFDICSAFSRPDYPHYMLIAPSGSGKTTTLKWLLDIASTQGSVVKVLTPHLMDDEFSPYDVVTDKTQIYWQIYELHKEMVHRYAQKPWAKHMDSFEHLTFAIDEAVSLFADFKAMDKIEGGDVAQKWVQLLVEARKVKIRLIVATQSNRVDAIGLRGRGDVMECMTKILLGKSAKARVSLLQRRKFWDDAKVEWVRSHQWFGLVQDADCHTPLFIPDLS